MDLVAEWVAACEAGNRRSLIRRRLRRARVQRLFAVACCRRPCVWGRLTDPRSVAAVEVAERYADGLASKAELRTARKLAWDAAFAADVNAYAAYAAYAAAVNADAAAYAALAVLNWRDEWAVQGRLFADLVLPAEAVFSPSWRTEAVVGIARGMYETRDFAPMPVLADALEDAGCTDAGIIAHCRGDAPHVRGCWVADLVLGKRTAG